MITVTTPLTGYEIGEALSGDMEELANCLIELANDVPVDAFWEISQSIQDPEVIGPFLRAMADAIDPPKEETTP